MDTPLIATSRATFVSGIEGLEERMSKLMPAYQAKFDSEPSFIVRAPGRVNLIGEHTDYSDYDVCPVAIHLDVLIAVGEAADGDGKCHLSNINGEYADYEFPADVSSFSFDSLSHGWFKYFLCGYKTYLDSNGLSGVAGAKSLNFMVLGTVPPVRVDCWCA